MSYRATPNQFRSSTWIPGYPGARSSLLLGSGLFSVMLIGFLITQEPGVSRASSSISQPFADGERLVFSVEWDPPWYLFFLPTMDAGEVELQLAGETEYKNRKAAKLLFKARSSGILARLARFEIDDEFVFLSDPATFCSLSISKKIREGKRKRQIDIVYIREKQQLYIREMDESTVPPTLKKEEVKNDIPACVRDPFSAIYYLRTLPLRREHTLTSLIGDDDKIKEIRSNVVKKEEVQTPFGKFEAWKVDTIAQMGGLFKEGGEFHFWLSADERKLPVQFEAKMHLGRALGKLISVENRPALAAPAESSRSQP
jgi:hypothetical protein